MLEDSLFESQPRKKARNPMTTAVSLIAHVVTVGVLVLVPLFQTQALTVPAIDMSLFLPRMQQPEPVQVFSAQPRVQPFVQVDPNTLIAPQAIPQQIAYVDEPPRPSTGFGNASGRSDLISLLTGIANQPSEVTAPNLPPPAPLAPPPVIEKAKPTRVSHLEPADLIHQVNPVYPTLAKQTRVQGIVVLEATISKSGTIETLRVVSGHPLLTQAALDAVKQWRYRPVMLNGEAIDIITTVTVRFTLQ